MESRLIPYCTDEFDSYRRVLVIAPHPDDEVFGCGGTLARLARRAVPAQIRVVVLTDGSIGGDRAIRERESLDAARALGLEPPEFVRLRDRSLRYGEALVELLLARIGAAPTDLVLAPSPWEVHPDHLATALAALEAARRHGGCDLLQYEVGYPLRPNRFVDITAQLGIKADAMRCFPSQLQAQRYDDQIHGLNRFRSFTLGTAVLAAEAFTCLRAAELAQWTRRDDIGFVLRRLRAAQVLPEPDGDALLPALLEATADRTPELEHALRAAHAALESIQASRSWRANAPLRALRRALRRP